METSVQPFMQSPFIAFCMGLGVYIITLILILIQKFALKKLIRKYDNIFLYLVNLELIAFLTIFFFILGAQALFAFSQTLVALWSLLLYFIGLRIFYSSSSKPMQKVQFLIPFTLPFLLFTFVLDLLNLLPANWFQTSNDLLNSIILLSFNIFFMILTMMFLPPVIQYVWLCKDLEDSHLKNRLETICKKANFKHAGIKTWTVMNDAFTAAIIGIIPRYRYVMFTKRLIQRLSPEAVEAVLTHEIGHSYRRHLWIYPFILFGMILLLEIFSMLFSNALNEYIILNNILEPSPYWEGINALITFIPYVIIIGIYFRLVFGYFSRLFERQADLHVFAIGIQPESMIEALNEIGIATGNTHLVPSWHHFGIQERIDFLKAAIHNPSLVVKHHRKVRKNLFMYLFFFIVASLIVLSPLFPELPIFKKINESINVVSDHISDYLTSPLIEKIYHNQGLTNED